MSVLETQETMRTFEVVRDEFIAAPIEVVFETILEQMGPLNATPDGVPLKLKIEPWPGGRWYRDLGDNAGHFWGNVQAIKPPKLLEFWGPLIMSAPAVSNVQFRLESEGAGTRLKFHHRAAGWIPAEHIDSTGVNKGWMTMLDRIHDAAERKHKEGAAK